jgi:O-antigen/teichoic acid export membrane protein
MCIRDRLNPVATRLFATEGAAAVVRLKKQVLPPLVYACFGLAAGVLVSGHDFIVIVASADKLGSAPVFVVAGVCLLLQPVIGTAGLGLLLVRKSRTVFGLTAAAAVFNIGLNYLMIPALGMMGAAYSVCASQLALQFAIYAFCPAELRCPPSARSVMTALFFGCLFVALCKGTDMFGLHNPWQRLPAAGAALLVVYVLPVLALDTRIRAWLAQRLARRGAGS